MTRPTLEAATLLEELAATETILQAHWSKASMSGPNAQNMNHTFHFDSPQNQV